MRDTKQMSLLLADAKDFGAFFAKQVSVWGQVVRENNIKAQERLLGAGTGGPWAARAAAPDRPTAAASATDNLAGLLPWESVFPLALTIGPGGYLIAR